MISIIIKEIKHNFRDKRAITLMIAFPLLLMVILGVVFNGQFASNGIDFSGAKVIYSAKEDGTLHKEFKEFAHELEEMNIMFEQIENEDDAIKKIQNDLYTCYISLDENSKELNIYKNNKRNTTASFIEGMLATFVQRYNLVSQIIEVNPNSIDEIMNKDIKNDYVKIVSIDEKKQARAIDYYGITMLTLIIMYSVNAGIFSIQGEQTIKTGDRIIGTPINKYKVFLGKVLGAFAVTAIQISIVILFSTKILGVNWGNDIVTILIIIITQIIMCISIGVGIGFLVSSQEVGNGIISAIIPLLVFLGGGYYPLERIGSDLLFKISIISPIRWINDSIFNVIYLNDYKYVSSTVVFNIVISFVFLLLANMKYRRREEI